MKLPFCIRLFATLLLLSSGYYSHGFYYQQYTTADGLVSNMVYHSLMDSKGYMWFFTDKGVSRFDGATFRNFKVADGLGDQDVFAGHEDRYGRLWLYNYNGNLNFIKDNKVYNAGNNSLLKNLPVISFMEFIYEAPDSSLYIAYRSGQIIKVRGDNYEWVIRSPNAWPDLMSMHKKGDTIKVNRTALVQSLLHDKVVRIDTVPTNLNFHDHAELHIIDGYGLKIFDDNGHLIWQLNDDYLRVPNLQHVYSDSVGHVFCSTKKGLFIVDRKTNKKDTLFEDIEVLSTSQDIYGNYWITTYGQGIFCLSKELNGIRPLQHINNSKLYAPDNKHIFFLKKTDMYHLDTAGRLELVGAIGAHGYMPLYINDRHFFFTSVDTTYHLDRRTKKVTTAFTILKSIYPLSNDRYLLVAMAELYNVRWENGKFIKESRISLPRIRQNCFNNGTLFFSCNNVLYTYKTASKSLEKLDSLNDHLSVSKLYVFENKLVVLTNTDKTIFYSIGADGYKKEIKHYPFACYSIQEMNAGNNKYLFNTSDGYYISSSLYDILFRRQLLEYPVAGRDVHLLHILGNNVVCDLNGVYHVFDVRSINREKMKPEFFIDKVLVNGKEYSAGVKTKNNGHTHLVIELSNLRFSKAPCTYEYRIIRDDTSHWLSTSGSKLDIFLESFGNHAIEIRTVTENGMVSGLKSLQLSIATPFYYSFRFYVLVVVGLLLLMFLIIKCFDLYRTKKFKEELNYLQLEHRSINSLLNPHFIFNAINNIQNLININSKEDANNYLVVLSKLIRQNIENLQFSFITISRELDLVRNYIVLQNLRFDNRIRLVLNDNIQDHRGLVVPPLLIHTFVENSIVHGFRKDQSELIITIDLDVTIDDLLVVRIGDNGVGLLANKKIATEPDKTSLGIDLIRQRSTRLSDLYKVPFSLDIRNAEEGNTTGTEVLIVLYAKFSNKQV